RVTEAVRFPVAVAPDSVRAKMLRWVSVSPKGDRVVYSALGRLYVKPLPHGAAKRLTTQSDHWEFYPAGSRDGRSIVYTTWNDSTLGSVRVVSAAGGAGRVLTRKPGHYVEPALSPDGQTVVYRATTGGYLFTPTWASDPGIYQVPAAGGPSRLVSRHGQSPEFGAASDRVYLTDVNGDDPDDRSLFSVDRAGTNERTHVKGVFFTEAHLSPDEKWIAFREKYKVWVAPAVRAGRPVDIGPGMHDLPVKLVANDAGDWLGWSGDSRTLHWSLGGQLYTRHLTELFKFAPRLAGDAAPDTLAETPARHQKIGFPYALDRPDGVIALVGAKLVTMKGDEIINDGALVVAGNRIQAIGPRSQVQIPRSAKVVDVS